MSKTSTILSLFSVAILMLPQIVLAQACDCGSCGSIVTAVSNDSCDSGSASVGCAVESNTGCTTGCSSEINECGRQGRLFQRRSSSNDCCGCDSGCSSCQPTRRGFLTGLLPKITFDVNASPVGSCCDSASCDGGCGGCGQGGILGRIRSFLPRIDVSVNNGCQDEGCDCQRKYLSVFAGYVDLHNFTIGNATATLNDGFVLGFARGRYLNDCVRWEMESAWRGNSGNTYFGATATPFDGHMNNFATMLNLYRDFGCNNIKPYIGGGVGFANQDGDFTVNGAALDIRDWAVAYQAMAGVSMKTRSCNELFLEYRYYGNSETTVQQLGVGDIGRVEYTSQNVVFGIRMAR